MNTKQKHISFLVSALTTENPLMPSERFLLWMKEINEKVHVMIDRIPFAGMREWHFNEDSGNLVHQSGEFFSIEGIRVSTNWGKIPVSKFDMKICAHVILGLPGETGDMMVETARFLAGQPIHGVKIHSLYVTKGTGLEKLYLTGGFSCMERDEYIERLIDFLELLPPHFIIQRLTGDPAANELVAPAWALEKRANLNLINKRLRERDTWQGRLYGASNPP